MPLPSVDLAQSVFDALPDAVLVVREDGRIVHANRQVETLLGYRAGDLVDQSIETLLPEEVRAAHRLRRARLFETPTAGPADIADLWLKRLDGTEVAVDVTQSCADIGGERLAISLLRDVSRQRAREGQYREMVEQASEIFYRRLFGTDPVQEDIVFISPQCEAVNGWGPEDLIKKPELWIESVHPEDRTSLVDDTNAMRSGGVPHTRIYRLRHRVSGEYRVIADRVVPLKDRQGRVTGYQGVARDITETRRLQVQLDQGRKMDALGRLAGGVAHEFNSLLTVIVGYCETCLRRVDPNSEVSKDLQEIAKAGTRGSELTHQLLAFGRQQVPTPSVVGVNAHLKGLEHLLQQTLGENIEVGFALSEQVWPVYMDPAQMDEAILTLAINACTTMPGGGWITVATANATLDAAFCASHVGSVPGEYVTLAVSDTGAGMDRATQDRAFEPFSSIEGAAKGSWLGLATAHGIVTQNGGFITARSERGIGTTVTIHIPRYQGEQRSSAAPLAPVQAGGHETVLLVEDDPHVRALAARLVRHLGYRLLEAADPEAAIAQCEAYEDRIDLLLTDVMLPTMNGVALSQAIRVLRPRISTLFMSGYQNDLLTGRTNRRIHYLQKPFTQDALASAIHTALRARDD